MLFNFHLCPFNQIPPWGGPSDRSLGWYGLSYGYYWLDVGDAELLRYNQSLVDLWAQRYPSAIWPPDMPYVDYQVARLWDDVIEMLPAVLDPIPPRLARSLGPDGAWAKWQRHAATVLELTVPRSEARSVLFDASHWWRRRSLDVWYLQAGPDIVFWSDGTDVRIEWNNRGLMLEGLPAWDAQIGKHRMLLADYLKEVEVFDTRFIRRMHDRVALAQVNWMRPDVVLDTGLNRAHKEYAHYLNQRMMPAFRREADDWNVTFQAIEWIEAYMPASSPRLL